MFIKIGSVVLLVLMLLNHVQIDQGMFIIVTGKYWPLSLLELIAGIAFAFIVKIVKKENKQLVS